MNLQTLSAAVGTVLSEGSWLHTAAALGSLVWLWLSAKRWLAAGDATLDRDDLRLASAVVVACCVTLSAMALGSFGLLWGPAWVVAICTLGVVLRLGARVAVRLPAALAAEPGPSIPFRLALGGLTVGLMLFVLRNPLTDRDSLLYHLPMWAYWLKTGTLAVALREPIEGYTAYPGGAEVLQAFAGWATQSDALSALPSIGALAVVALSLRRVAIELGAAPALAEASTLLLLSNRGVMALGRGTQVDMIMAAWVVIAVRFALRYRAQRAPRDLGLTLVALGLATSCRFNGPALALVVITLAVFAPPRVDFVDVRRVGPWPWAIAALLGGFWWVRNFAATGNPLYPAEVPFFTSSIAPAIAADVLRNTTQWAMWQQGYAGHLTLANMMRFFGPALALVSIALAWPLMKQRRTERTVVGALALVAFGLFLISPFSGANWSYASGSPPLLAPDNVRFLLAPISLMVALGVGVLSGSRPLAWLGASMCVALTLWQLGPSLARVIAGVVVVAPAVWAMRAPWSSHLRSLPLRVLGVALGALGLTLALAVTAAGRERIMAGAWQNLREHAQLEMLDSTLVRRVRAAAGDRAVACVGLRSVHQLTGSDLSTRVLYLPISSAGTPAAGTFRWGSDDRTRGDQAAWSARVDAGAPALLVLVHSPDTPARIEARWAAADSSRFTLFAVDGRDTVYTVHPPRP